MEELQNHSHQQESLSPTVCDGKSGIRKDNEGVTERMESKIGASHDIIEILSDDSDSDDTKEVVADVSDTRAFGLEAKRRRLGGCVKEAPYPHNTGPKREVRLCQAETPNDLQQMYQPTGQAVQVFNKKPIYVAPTQGFVPTWNHLLPNHGATSSHSNGSLKYKAFQLSLLNVSEFTIAGLPTELDGPPTSLSGLRSHIKQISRRHGKAVWERAADGSTGKWRIPLGAYHAFHAFLKSDPMTSVDGIPETQLKIASIGRARLEKGYPSAEKLISHGVPSGLANALAPFQRDGVEFVIEKEGRALIADEMGLGKTVQAIASMTAYEKEWPLLVLCPSSARYHWESEFQHWLGADSTINKPSVTGSEGVNPPADEPEPECSAKRTESGTSIDLGLSRSNTALLQSSQIHVLETSKDLVLPLETTRVVVCSYGLAPNLILQRKIYPGQFRCVVVDESHMLKNKATKRTSTLLPVLIAANRVVLLSGTPAFARPVELWPQLVVLGTERHGWWQDEAGFFAKYVKGGSTRTRAELHAMLTGTVMIRRMKADILKSLPTKVRERAMVEVTNDLIREEVQFCMEMLRKGKGTLSNLARKHTGEDPGEQSTPYATPANNSTGTFMHTTTDPVAPRPSAIDAINRDVQLRYTHGMERIRHALTRTPHQLNEDEMEVQAQQMEGTLRAQLDVYYRERMHQLMSAHGYRGGTDSPAVVPSPEALPPAAVAPSRKNVLNRMYSLTGKAKISVVVEMLKLWLDDPTKGKVCIFAHHVSVLDAIAEGAGLLKSDEGCKRYIRIDGSTSPLKRQEQINLFQTDPTVRTALLGITAAGIAVTLTASSTVWFAELFWTPALMLQAEDRCHRIGQQARVRCLYIVAKGTLDELLWKLIEKKFQDLGEFVEGKEKMELIVERIHGSKRELLSSIFDVENRSFRLGMANGSGEATADFAAPDPNETGTISMLADIDNALQHDIEELGMTEQLILRASEADEQEREVEEKTGVDANVPEKTGVDANVPPDGDSSCPNDDEIGRTESAAICLCDDDIVHENTSPATAESTQKFATNFDRSTPFPRLRLYKMLFCGPSYGIEVAVYQGRIIVIGKHPDRSRKLGENVKPDVGDILVAVSGMPVPVSTNLTLVLQLMQHAIAKPPAEITFAEDSEFAEFFSGTILPGFNRQGLHLRGPSESLTSLPGTSVPQISAAATKEASSSGTTIPEESSISIRDPAPQLAIIDLLED